MESSLNPMHRTINDFEIKGDDARTFKNLTVYSTKVCGPWKFILEQKAKEAGMAVSTYVQQTVEARFPVEMQEELARTHGVTLAHQRRELFMHVWPDLPVWNVWSQRVLILPNAPRRGRPAGSKNTSHNRGPMPTSNVVETNNTPNVEPMRYALNGLVLTPAGYDEIQAMADAKNQSMHQTIQEMLHTWATKRIQAREQTPVEEV